MRHWDKAIHGDKDPREEARWPFHVEFFDVVSGDLEVVTRHLTARGAWFNVRTLTGLTYEEKTWHRFTLKKNGEVEHLKKLWEASGPCVGEWQHFDQEGELLDDGECQRECCKYCGRPDQFPEGAMFSSLMPHLGACMKCVNTAMADIRQAEDQ